jgi:hypothetical protein
MRHQLVIGVVAGLATVAAGATAAAKPLDGGEFTNEFSGVVEDFCEVDGLTIEFHSVVEGRFRAVTKGKDGLVYFDEHLDVTNTLTNEAKDNSVTEHVRLINKDLSVTDNGDGTLTIILLSTGNATIYDDSGKAIGRNPGQVRVEFVVDHAGTPDFPPDDILLSETLVKGSTGRSDDFCEVVVPALT